MHAHKGTEERKRGGRRLRRREDEGGGGERPPPSPSLEEDQYETAEGKAAKGDPTNFRKQEWNLVVVETCQEHGV